MFFGDCAARLMRIVESNKGVEIGHPEYRRRFEKWKRAAWSSHSSIGGSGFPIGSFKESKAYQARNFGGYASGFRELRPAAPLRRRERSGCPNRWKSDGPSAGKKVKL